MKRPGWHPGVLSSALVGRSHRSSAGQARLREVLARTRDVLGIPPDHLVAIVPGSDTGAVELALWSLLGARGVDVLAWEAFGRDWVADVISHLKIADARTLDAPYGSLPDLAAADFDRDVIFTWNGTSSGVRVPSADFIPATRRGLTICDATSAVFAQRLDWSKLDVTTFSWQKALGGEAAHGMLVLGPRAVERLESYEPPWPLPKLFRVLVHGRLMHDLFEGWVINTPSMLCVEDCLDALRWAEAIGGLPALTARADRNAAVLRDWLKRTPWLEDLAHDPATRSNTSVCLRFADPAILAADDGAACAKHISELLEREDVAYDIGSYRSAPPGLRIWCGCTVEAEDIALLLPWLDWGFAHFQAHVAQTA